VMSFSAPPPWRHPPRIPPTARRWRQLSVRVSLS